METLAPVSEQLPSEVELPPLKREYEQVLALILAGEKPTSAYRQVYECADSTAKTSSSRLMANENFKLHLTRARAALAVSSKLSHGWVLDKLKGIVKDCLDKGKGFNPGVATRALELIGKHLGTFEPKVSDEHRPAFVGISINMGDKPSVQVIRAQPQQSSSNPLKKLKESEGGPPETRS